MKYIIREIAYLFIMITHKIKSAHLIVGFRAKADKNAKFEGYNKLSHHSFFSGEMGYASYIGANSVVIGKIGRYCSIADNVHFLTLTHPIHDFVSTHPCFYSMKRQSGFTFAKKQLFDEENLVENTRFPVIVGNDVYIGFGATIISPCVIGDGAVIASGAVVTKNVEPYEIVGGVPARRINYRMDEEERNFMMKLKWWNKDVSWLKDHSEEFEQVDMFIKKNKEEV